MGCFYRLSRAGLNKDNYKHTLGADVDPEYEFYHLASLFNDY